MNGNSPNSDSDTSGRLAAEPAWAEQSWLRSIIVARLGSSDGVDDVLQEVRIAAIEQRAPLREPAAFRSWLMQVAVRQSLLFLRRVGRYRRLLVRAANQNRRAAPEGDGLAWILQTERQELIRRALQELAGRDRELLMLKYVEGWSYQQIADARGATVRSVENRVCRARGRLRDRLRQLDLVDHQSGSSNDD